MITLISKKSATNFLYRLIYIAKLDSNPFLQENRLMSYLCTHEYNLCLVFTFCTLLSLF